MKMMYGKNIGFIEWIKMKFGKSPVTEECEEEVNPREYMHARISGDKKKLEKYDHILALDSIKNYNTAPQEFNEKILGYSDAVVQNALRNIDFSQLACALFGANQAVLEKICSQLSRRAANMLLEEMQDAIRAVNYNINNVFGSNLREEVQQLTKGEIETMRQRFLDLLAREAERED
ncbi:MAG: hypothetical protein LBK68_07815 [Candidatus Margulisbacteria bacterium]|jgi:hypothetical protein|nr:hypothetical protein [Candidatus Margulisiibacteriota bacterium]